MKPTSSLKRGLVRVHKQRRAARYDRALEEVNRLLQEWPDNPHLLVLWADLVQLQEGETGPSLGAAKAAYRRAADLDEDAPAALIELGHYVYAIDDDARAAAKHFAKAITLCKQLLREALLGRAEALAEMGRRSDALACLAEAYWLQSHNGKSPAAPPGEDILARLESLRQAE